MGAVVHQAWSGRAYRSKEQSSTRAEALGRFLARFPRGSIIALGVRAEVGKRRHPLARQITRRFGARLDLDEAPEAGYAAIGVLGAPPGTAVEARAARGYARARVGRRPPPWREIARYSAIRLR